MAIMDSRLEFSSAQTMIKTASATPFNSTSDIALTAVRDLGQGQPVYLVVAVGDTAIITAGSAGTMKFLLVSDAATACATDGTATIHAASEEFITDDLAAEIEPLKANRILWSIALPSEGVAYEAILGLQVIIATTNTTAGTLDAYLTLTPPTSRVGGYNDGTN